MEDRGWRIEDGVPEIAIPSTSLRAGLHSPSSILDDVLETGLLVIALLVRFRWSSSQYLL
jgi:hypothetical protein